MTLLHHSTIILIMRYQGSCRNFSSHSNDHYTALWYGFVLALACAPKPSCLKTQNVLNGGEAEDQIGQKGKRPLV